MTQSRNHQLKKVTKQSNKQGSTDFFPMNFPNLNSIIILLVVILSGSAGGT
jgi:hypothetical protein